jgi:hypothetical protein
MTEKTRPQSGGEDSAEQIAAREQRKAEEKATREAERAAEQATEDAAGPGTKTAERGTDVAVHQNVEDPEGVENDGRPPLVDVAQERATALHVEVVETPKED